MGKSVDGPGACSRRRAARGRSDFSACVVALGLATSGCSLGYNGLGPVPVEAGEHADPDDAQAADAAARDSRAPDDDDAAAHDAAAPHRDAAAQDSGAADAADDQAAPDVVGAPEGGPDAPSETDAGCDPVACMTPACCGDSCETAHSNGAGGTYYDCNPLGTYGAATAMAACLAFAGGDSSKCSDGWDCSNTSGDQQVCYVDSSAHCTTYCWNYAGATAGALSDCSCPVVKIADWN
jgi:hypothetical protein